MRNIDMILVCKRCRYYKVINYSNGSVGIGCLAYNMESSYPVDINKLKRCPLGKNEKR